MTEEPEEYQEPQEEQEEPLIAPEPPALGRSDKLKERVICPDCGRQVSAQCLKFTHRCKRKRKHVEKKLEPVAEEPKPPTKAVKMKPPEKSITGQCCTNAAEEQIECQESGTNPRRSIC